MIDENVGMGSLSVEPLLRDFKQYLPSFCTIHSGNAVYCRWSSFHLVLFSRSFAHVEGADRCFCQKSLVSDFGCQDFDSAKAKLV
jgi:hypothetical protein